MTAPARSAATGLLDPRQLAASLPDALGKLDPRVMWRNPVMLIVQIGAVFTTVLAAADPTWFGWLITGWLWLTVVFANLAEAVAEGRGKAQADTLRKTRQGTIASRVTNWKPGVFISVADVTKIPAPELAKGDLVVVEAGVDIDGRQIRKGAAAAVMHWVRENGGHPTTSVGETVDAISASGGTPLVVAERTGREPARALGVVHLKDVVKEGMRERFDQMRRMGIRTVMITGDNPLTARSIAAEAGVDDFLAEAAPEDKLELIRKEQAGGRLVAMTGDGTNDAPALAQADVGVAMNTGTSAAKEAGNMVDLDSDPTKLIEIVEIGKQLLMTRGALTTFSISNDIAKYFAIIPAIFASVYPSLDRLNVMALASPQSAILAAVIFNALVIVALIPLALRGVFYRPSGAEELLRRNLLLYGLGGVVTPFLGIKVIDLVVQLFPGMS